METSFSSLRDYQSLSDLLIDMGISKSQLKKSELKKNYLGKSIRKKDEISLPIDLLNRLQINACYQGQPISILYEDETFVALDKPAGVHCHPLSYDEGDNCLSFIREMGRGAILNVNASEYDRGLMYRLDKETSGVLFYIKDNEAHSEIRENFNNIVKEKIYYAVTSAIPHLTGEVTQFFTPSGEKGSKMRVEESGKQEGKMSISVEKSDGNLHLIKVELISGVRHQIRAGLAALGAPILGDTIYGGEDSERLYLHAWKYSFEWKGKIISSLSLRPDKWAVLPVPELSL